MRKLIVFLAGVIAGYLVGVCIPGTIQVDARAARRVGFTGR